MIPQGVEAPDVPGVTLGEAPRALWFFKVTCPVCQATAPVAQNLNEAYPGTVFGVGQDPDAAIASFSETYGTRFPVVSEPPPFEVSDSYGIEVVPALAVVGRDGDVVHTVESWDREGYNEAARILSELTGVPYASVSDEGDGLPPFRPG